MNLRAALPTGMFSHYWQAWLPYAIAALLLGTLAGLAALHATGVRRIAPAGTFALAALALAVLGGLAAILADAAAEGDGLTVFDRPTWQWFIDHRSPAATAVAKVVTTVGSTLVMGVLAGLTAALLWWRRRRGDAVLTAVVAAGAGLIVVIGKRAVGRQRPPADFRLVTETNASFPSGHALASTAILGTLTVLLVAGTRPVAARIGVVAAALTLIAAIGISRLYLGVHWATDVLGGWLTGAGWLLLCVVARRLWRSYRDNAQHGGPTGNDPGTTDLDHPGASDVPDAPADGAAS
ncbi:phosphatase PAP2 family protein [Nakamurella lactea]|uniref:phosphatase PAP2 family protein n=1 Tax=Nakamurella lactea TaxID=459515 RepID=UPI000428BA1C|nr:phosphatase PAP2 family protein [Nakamurella lactea]